MGNCCRIVAQSMCDLRNLNISRTALTKSRFSDLIFSIAELVSFLSQGTTLPAGTVIITGTPAGVGVGRDPKVTIRHGDEFLVQILPHIGTLVNVFENEI